jgi:hypothetical protein
MAEVKDFAGKTLEWARKGIMDRNYELRGGNEIVATITWTKIWGTLAEGTIGGIKYTLKRNGFFNPYITVRKPPFDEDVARLDMKIGGNGTLQFPNGKRYSFQKMSFWGFKWSFTNENGDLIMTVGAPSLVKSNGEIVIEPGAASDRNLPLLVLLCWYTAVQMIEEATTAAASSAGA